jgi:hypothetical protein
MRSKAREALIGLLVELRPSWGSEGVRAALNDPSVAMISEGKLALVFVKAAMDQRLRTPVGALQPGPHWDEVGAPTAIPAAFVAPKPLTDEEREAATAAAESARAALEVARLARAE